MVTISKTKLGLKNSKRWKIVYILIKRYAEAFRRVQIIFKTDNMIYVRVTDNEFYKLNFLQ